MPIGCKTSCMTTKQGGVKQNIMIQSTLNMGALSAGSNTCNNIIFYRAQLIGSCCISRVAKELACSNLKCSVSICLSSFQKPSTFPSSICIVDLLRAIHVCYIIIKVFFTTASHVCIGSGKSCPWSAATVAKQIYSIKTKYINIVISITIPKPQ